MPGCGGSTSGKSGIACEPSPRYSCSGAGPVLPLSSLFPVPEPPVVPLIRKRLAPEPDARPLLGETSSSDGICDSNDPAFTRMP